MIDTAPKRRWFRFSLLAMFVVVTVFGGWIGRELHVVQNRERLLRLIESRDGQAISWKDHPRFFSDLARPESEWPRLPFWREWLGDTTMLQISIPQKEGDELLHRLEESFPEAECFLRVPDDPQWKPPP
jgi:hypothetical protein